MPPVLLKSESLAVLDDRGLVLIQDKNGFGLNEDSVALAAFGRAMPGEKVLELGSGNGGVLFLSYSLEPAAFYTGVELLAANCRLAQRSLELNAENFAGITDRMHFIEQDLRLLPGELLAQSFDRVLCNPPYFPKDAGRISPNPRLAAAKWELFCDLKAVLSAARIMLKPAGELDLVLPPARLAEFLALASADGWQICRRQPLLNQKGEFCRQLLALTLAEKTQSAGDCLELSPLNIEQLQPLWF